MKQLMKAILLSSIVGVVLILFGLMLADIHSETVGYDEDMAALEEDQRRVCREFQKLGGTTKVRTQLSCKRLGVELPLLDL